MDLPFDAIPTSMIDRWIRLDACDSYVVLVSDGQAGETDAYGPFDGLEAVFAAEQLRRDLIRAALADVAVTVTRLHRQPVMHPRRGE
jgi:hypothetical protein